MLDLLKEQYYNVNMIKGQICELALRTGSI